MRLFSNEEIQNLVAAPKRITVRPQKRMQLSNKHYRNGMKLKSTDGELEFSVFMRKNEMFHENFSIGLVFHPKDDPQEVHLFRCNGPHGPHESFDHHESCHIHIAKEDSMGSGIKENWFAYITKEYSTFEDALIFFLGKCNIVNAGDYFDLEARQTL